MQRSFTVTTCVVSCFLFASCATTSQGQKHLSDTEKARLYLDVANGALEEQDAIGCLENVAIAEKLDPNIPELHHTKALAFYARHDLTRAIEEARVAVKLKPDYSDANNTLGRMLIDDGKMKEAEAPLLAAANDPLFRGSYKARTNLGILYYRQTKLSQAQAQFDRAILDSPSSSCIAHYYLGHIQLARGSMGDAIHEYDLATQKFCAGFADAHLALGIAYERNHEFDRARKKFLDVRNAFPNSKVAEEAMDRLRYLP